MTSFDKKSHSHAPLQLCIFDDRRGEKEGQEADKILGFYPSNTPPDSQAALVGLDAGCPSVYIHLPTSKLCQAHGFPNAPDTVCFSKHRQQEDLKYC